MSEHLRVRRTCSPAAAGLTLLVLLLVTPIGRAQVSQVPNLVPLPPYGIHVGWADEAESFEPGQPRAIRFSVTTANRGAYALDLLGDPNTLVWAGLGPEERPAAQCVWWASRACVHREAVGAFVWHQEHSHWHFEDYAVYELRRLQGGVPDMSPAGLVVPGRKASFCLMDTWQEDEAPSGHDPLASLAFYGGCSPHLQGISPGWADTYDWSLAGQQIPLPEAGIPDGEYAIVTHVNPLRALHESSYVDNFAYTVVRVTDGGEAVECPGQPIRCEEWADAEDILG